ncbi:endolytic transglycosylase MltG [Planctomonas psychrotolerans]|uniref:endolytic transglycosylase MltG n=1 Tax=Planctomonas psychrotolerans TaxID=2528712 RepID=UPI001D0D1D7F|nr:endolytic transglycosylase MltG [Planctomonas psychrotolerans]
MVIPAVSGIFAPSTAEDYAGPGEGEVTVLIESGATGSSIGDTLAEAGVVASSAAFYEAVVATVPEPVFQPGTYLLAEKMSARAALERLQDPTSRIEDTVTIPEGTTVSGVLPLLADATDVPLADLEAAAADHTSFGLPAEAPRLEGYLFPATYTFQPDTSARDMLQRLVDRQFQALDEAGVPEADRHRVLTLASIVQKEARYDDDFYKAARVFVNRLDQGMALQSDATVSYGVSSTGRVSTTDAERADPNPYNTYVYPGLPVGPISNPGDLAIKAAMNPAEGPWLYFVTVNTLTGETKFSETFAQHEAAVAEWMQFMRDNPGNG